MYNIALHEKSRKIDFTGFIVGFSLIVMTAACSTAPKISIGPQKAAAKVNNIRRADSFAQQKEELEQRLTELSRKEQESLRANDVLLAAKSLPYARLADAAYKYKIDDVDGFERFSEEDYPDSWRQWFLPKTTKGGMIIDRENLGFGAIVFRKKKSNEIVIAFKGTELRLLNPSFRSRGLKNLETVKEQWLGKSIPAHFTEALSFAKQIHEKHPESILVSTGSSLGGGIAQYVGLMMGHRVFAFNALALNNAELKSIEETNPQSLDDIDRLITILSIEGDSVSDYAAYLSKSIVNPYKGTVIKIPYYARGWSTSELFSYYGTLHHLSGAIVKSLETFVAGADRKVDYALVRSDEENFIDQGNPHEILADREFKVINATNRNVNVVVFSCTYSSLFHLVGATHCDNSLFNSYPHRPFALTEHIQKAKSESKIPIYSWAASVTLGSKPVRSVRLKGRGKEDSVGYFDTFAPQKLPYPMDSFYTDKWHYISAYNSSPECSSNTSDKGKIAGEVHYLGKWPRNYFGTNTQGWIADSSSSNPRVFAIRAAPGNDPCDFVIEGI